MKDWKLYVDECIETINDIQELPDKGILAGGSLANLLWEKISGNTAKINDIDIFVVNEFKELKGLKDYNEKENYEGFVSVTDFKFERKKERNKKNNPDIWNPYVDNTEYSHISTIITNNNYVKILNSSRNGDINYISFDTAKYNPNDVIKSFDINCTQVAYDLETKELYYTENFDIFLNTGELKVSNSNTPCHTSIRIAKKSQELKGTIIDFDKELGLLKLILRIHVKDYKRKYFSDKYAHMYEKYKFILDKYWKLEMKNYNFQLSIKYAIDKGVTTKEEVENFMQKHNLSKYSVITPYPEKNDNNDTVDNWGNEYLNGIEYDQDCDKKETENINIVYKDYVQNVLKKNYNLYTLIPIGEFEEEKYHQYPFQVKDLKIKEIEYYFRNIKEYPIKEVFWKSKLLRYFRMNNDYINSVNFEDPKINDKVRLIDKFIDNLQGLEFALKNYNFDKQYDLVLELRERLRSDHEYYFFLKYSTSDFEFTSDENKERFYKLIMFKNRENIKKMKEWQHNEDNKDKPKEKKNREYDIHHFNIFAMPSVSSRGQVIYKEDIELLLSDESLPSVEVVEESSNEMLDLFY